MEFHSQRTVCLLLQFMLCVALCSCDGGADERFAQKNVLPIIQWVERFEAKHRRLPNQFEFHKMVEGSFGNKACWYVHQKPKWTLTWPEGGRAFLVGRWSGEGVVFVQSWDRAVLYFSADKMKDNEIW